MLQRPFNVGATWISEDRLLDVEALVEPRKRPDGKKPHVRSGQVFRKAPEPEFFPLELSDDIRHAGLCRAIKAGLDEVDLTSVTTSYTDQGGVPYEVRSMLGILVLGYCLGIRSSRALEDACRCDVRFSFVSGGLRPDDRTIGRFRRRVGSRAKKLQKAIVGSLDKHDLAPAEQVAVDGTKQRSAASRPRKSAEELEKLGVPIPSSDPEAKLMKGSRGFVLGYNVQVAVDMGTGAVLAVDVCDTSSDRGLLAPMVAEVKEMLGRAPAEVVADKGYDSNEAHNYGSEIGTLTTVPSQDPGLAFWNVVDANVVTCPMGKEVVKDGVHMSRGRLTVHRSVPLAECESCFLREQCRPNGCTRGLETEQGVDPALRILAAYRARSPEGRAALKRRMATVEPFFGGLKWNRKMSRLSLRGTGGALIENLLFAAAVNLGLIGRAVLTFFCLLFSSPRTSKRHNIAFGPTRAGAELLTLAKAA